jgi:diguanylate cyclase (GGDEF)-like protein/PAS domain S-box-containing protein
MTEPDLPARPGPLRRLHAALMPDHDRGATLYWWAVVLGGSVALGAALAHLGAQPIGVWLQVAAGAAIAMLAGLFMVRIPGVKARFAAGEIFIFLLLLMHGPAAAVVAAAAGGAVTARCNGERWTNRVGTPAMAALAMGAAGLLHQALIGPNPGSAPLLIVGAMASALGFFVLNAQLAAAMGRLRRGERLLQQGGFDGVGWVAVAFAANAAVASLLYLVYLNSGLGVLAAMVTTLGMLLATLHYLFRQQEAAEAARAASAEAAERELQASERRFHSAFTHASIGMVLLAFDGRILQANEALRALLGRSRDELVGSPFPDLVLDDDRARLRERLALVNEREFEGFALELRCRHRDGHAVWVSAHCSFFSEPGSGEPCLILQVQDITARRKAERDLHHLAFHDSLTGLPNRRRFHEMLGHAVVAHLAATEADEGGTGYAVMFLDFDRFKLINDSLGHDAGDVFLVQVASRIVEHLRPHDVVARLGGDEFAVLVRHVDGERTVVAMAERLMDALKRPFVVAGTELMTSASIGITFSALGYTNAEAVLRDADTAMYKAKGAGKARYALFDASLHTEVADRLRLEGELRHAIDDGRLSVIYQPVYELPRDDDAAPRLAGFEALVRWTHPVDGTISPGRFLPIAEEAGLIVRVTDFVLHCACRQLKAWQQASPDHANLTMNVNVSGHDIAHPALVARVSRALVESGVSPRHLCIELTENNLMSRVEGALGTLTELKQLGVLLAIDDFGTGYSSLSHLSTLPLDCLKIDRSFVARLGAGRAEEAVVRSIVLLGSSLGKAVVAEGIETAEQLERLRRLGCRYGQGYLLGRPQQPQQLSSVLAAEPASVALRAATSPTPWASSTLH